jgi:hypothetical protein
VVVQGTSFVLHKFAVLGESQADDHAGRWRDAAAVDELIATTAVIAVVSFGTLYTFALAPIRELALASACGVVWVLILATVFLPAFDLARGRTGGVGRAQRPRKRPGRQLERLLDAAVAECARAVGWLALGRRPWFLLAGVGGAFAVAAGLFNAGVIVSRTRALEFIRGTLIERQARFLNTPGQPGFEFLDLLVEPAGGGNIHEPAFLTRAWAYQTALRGIAGARETLSILPALQRISRASLHAPFPATRQEGETVLLLLEQDLPRPVARQLFFPGGLRISVSYGFDDSVQSAYPPQSGWLAGWGHLKDG